MVSMSKSIAEWLTESLTESELDLALVSMQSQGKSHRLDDKYPSASEALIVAFYWGNGRRAKYWNSVHNRLRLNELQEEKIRKQAECATCD